MLLASVLRIRNDDAARAVVVRVWHRSNAFMSDGDSPWLDETGVPTTERSRDHSVPPGQALELAVQEELALTVVPDSAAESMGIVDSVRGYLRTGSTASGTAANAGADSPFSLANAGTAPLRIRLFESSTFQFSPLREFALPAGEMAALSTGAKGISVRVA